MKNLFLFLAFSLIGTAYSNAQAIMVPPNNKKVQVAILFDTSSSMNGLIDQAKTRIWNIVNEVSSLKYNGQTPSIEIALYHYGNSGLSPDQNYIQQILGLTTDLDVLSQKLFALTTSGGSEFCGAVIGKSLTDLKWSSNPTDLKMIYIAGNESFAQGPIKYKEECKKAAKLGIFINTIFCGSYENGVALFWKDGASCSQGDYFNIDSDKAIAHINTPYDDDINLYNDSLNSTYYGYGIRGAEKKQMQATEDANAEMQSMSVKAERSIVKSKSGVYDNSSWDLIDAVEGGKKLEEIKEEELPDEFKGKTDEEKKVLLDEKSKDREAYQTKISELAKTRQAYIAIEREKMAAAGEADDFGTSVNKSIMKKAVEIGFEKEAQNNE